MARSEPRHQQSDAMILCMLLTLSFVALMTSLMRFGATYKTVRPMLRQRQRH